MILARTLRTKCALLVVVCGLAMGVASEAAAQQINLAWDPSGGTVGYRVHVGQQSGSYLQHFDVGSATAFTYPNATAGQRFCFAVSAYLLSSEVEGPNSAEVCGYSNAPPTLQNPGDRTSVVGQPTSLQLVGSDPQQPMTYSASGLPPGLSVQSSTGYISGTGTTAGTYNVTARANDGTLTATQQFTWTMTTSTGGGGGGSTGGGSTGGGSTGGGSAGGGSTGGGSTGGGSTGPDTTRPTIAISSPTAAESFTTSSASLTVGGTAADNVAVARVMWSNDQTGGIGVASGTTNWSISIPLASGTNYITVRSYDAAGNQSAGDNLSITRGTATTTPPTQPPPTQPLPTQPPPSQPLPTQPPPTQPPSSSSLSLGTGLAGTTALLEWTGGASWPSVDVYRNGVLIRNTANDGYYAEYLSNSGRFDYRVCAPGSTTVCSNTSTVTY